MRWPGCRLMPVLVQTFSPSRVKFFVSINDPGFAEALLGCALVSLAFATAWAFVAWSSPTSWAFAEMAQERANTNAAAESRVAEVSLLFITDSFLGGSTPIRNRSGWIFASARVRISWPVTRGR